MRVRHTKRKCVTVLIVLFLCYFYTTDKKGNILNFSRSIFSSKLKKFAPVIISRNESKTLRTRKTSDYEYFTPSSYKLKDWHNYTFIGQEKQRIGLGEQGKAASLPEEELLTEFRMMHRYRVNVALGDKIPLNRSLPDVRHPKCKKKLYLESLPTVSVIVTFNNEHLTTLLRTVHSILNRSPESLIKEIFLVDDASGEDYDRLKAHLDNYVKENFRKVKVVRLAKRGGIVGARLAGAKRATADVLIFLDSHMEVNVNWLPPLLEPIALDCRTAVVPIIDCIDRQTFEYRKTDGGARGWYDWLMNYVRNPLLPKDINSLPEPFETPVMMGIVAISRFFFWELGGYDTELLIWAGEQMELSFKIWMCGGRLLEAPCSRVGHVVRDTRSIYEIYVNNSARNYRRVIEVWTDEFSKLVYKRSHKYKNVEPGNLTELKTFRKKCKSFDWFMTEVAYDIMQNITLMELRLRGRGRIRPLGNKKLCIDEATQQEQIHLVLTNCSQDTGQIFHLTNLNEIKDTIKNHCWDVPHPWNERQVLLNCCDGFFGTQEWHYNEDLKLIEHTKSEFCLDHDARSLKVFVSQCNKNSETQRWVIPIDKSDAHLYP